MEYIKCEGERERLSEVIIETACFDGLPASDVVKLGE